MDRHIHYPGSLVNRRLGEQTGKEVWVEPGRQELEVKNDEKKMWPVCAKHVKICKRYPC